MNASEVVEELDKKRRIEQRTQEEVAKELGISTSAYNGYVNGKIKPSTQTVIDMFCILKDTRTVFVTTNENGEKEFETKTMVSHQPIDVATSKT